VQELFPMPDKVQGRTALPPQRKIPPVQKIKTNFSIDNSINGFSSIANTNKIITETD
jgi:hypothetical protein